MSRNHSYQAGKALLGLTVAVLVLCAFAVIFVLPKYVAQPAKEGEIAATGSVAEPAVDRSKPASAANPELALERREAAQSALEQILLSRERLESKYVQDWAGSDFEAVLQDIKHGESAYQRQDFDSAANIYQAALEKLNGLEARIDEVLTKAVADGAAAIDNGDAVAAKAAFDLAVKMAPDDETAAQGLARAATLDQVSALLAEGAAHETAGDEKAAIASYQRALEIDPQTSLAEERIRAIKSAGSERAFKEAMSAGYTALQKRDAKAANQAFQRARKIKPNSPEVSEALRQTAYQASSEAIEQLLSEAGEFESQERWKEAAERYKQVLTIDNKLLAALDGQQRSAARWILEQRIAQTLAHPERLADDKVYEEAQGLQRAAESISSPGIKHRQQLDQLTQLLASARTPVAVNIRSNNLTEVTVYKVGKLGQFESQQLDLIPGRYIAVGTREGYRDVRVEFSVPHSGPAPTVVVECQEKIAFGSG
jgi:hypothetical protein